MGGVRTLMAGASLCFLLCCSAFSQDKPGFTIGGTVVQANTHQPINRVLVTIAQTQHPEHRLSMVTVADGRFSFSGIPAGKYSLSAQIGSSPARTFRQDGQYSTAIVTGPNLDTGHIVFAVEQLSSISGTVVDEEGEPVRGAQAHLFRSGVLNGRHAVIGLGQAVTDAAGEFYWGHLEPGTYLVGVQARPWYAQNFRPSVGSTSNGIQATASSDLDVAYPVTYSGGATDPDSAAPIQIAAGSPATIQIALRPVPALHIKLISSTQSSRPPNVTLSAVGPGESSIPVSAQTFSVSSEGREMGGVAPGKYWLTAQRFQPQRFEVLGQQKAEITGDTTLDLDSLPKLNLSGKLAFEGAEPPKRGANVVLIGQGHGRNAFLRAGPDGSLSVFGMTEPGQYELALANASGYYLKSVEVKGGNYSGGLLTVPESGAVQLSLTAARGTLDIDGIALQNDQPVAGAMVLLLPKDSNAAYIPRDQSDSDGSFTLRNVPPGEYTAVAIDNGRDLPYADAEAMKPYLVGGTAVSASLQNEAKLKVNVQARQK